MGEKDVLEKTLEAYDDVFADIVNGLFFKGEQVIREGMLAEAQPFSMYKADGRVHEQERDVSKYWTDSSGRQVNVRVALLGVENQTQYDKDMPLRVIGYDGAAYRAELSKDERYPVITLVLYFGNQAWGKNRTLYDAIQVPRKVRKYVSNYRINVFEIAWLPEEAVSYFHSDFAVVVDYFIHRRTNPDYRPKNPQKFQHVDELLKLLSVLTNDPRFAEMLTEEGEKPKDMCDVLDRAEARGIEKGIEQGIEQGIERGIEKSRLESIRNVMSGLHYTVQQAMDLLNIPLDEREKYLSKI